MLERIRVRWPRERERTFRLGFKFVFSFGTPIWLIEVDLGGKEVGFGFRGQKEVGFVF